MFYGKIFLCNNVVGLRGFMGWIVDVKLKSFVLRVFWVYVMIWLVDVISLLLVVVWFIVEGSIFIVLRLVISVGGFF